MNPLTSTWIYQSISHESKQDITKISTIKSLNINLQKGMYELESKRYKKIKRAREVIPCLKQSPSIDMLLRM